MIPADVLARREARERARAELRRKRIISDAIKLAIALAVCIMAGCGCWLLH